MTTMQSACTEEDSLRPKLFTFTVDDACAMGATDIFRDTRVELIGGQFIVKEPGLPSHSGMVNRLVEWFRGRPEAAPLLHVQNPLHISDVDLPEPDLAILRRRQDFYENGHPEPKDVLLVIEVANTSLRFDQSTKAALYATAGIGAYWVVDVNAETVFVHTDPRDGTYRTVQRRSHGDRLAVPKADQIQHDSLRTNIYVPVADLFPTTPESDFPPDTDSSSDTDFPSDTER